MTIPGESNYINPGIPFLDYSIDGEDILSQNVILRGFTYQETLASKVEQHRAHFFDSDGNVLSNLLLSGDSEISYRFGWVGTDAPRSKTRAARLVAHAPVFDTAGVDMHIDAADESLRINRGVKNRSFNNKTISDMVQEIADDNSLEAVIEPTKGTFTFPQVWASDIQFIRWALLRRAVSALTGRGDYDFYFKDGKELHFHTPDYSQNVFRRYVWATLGQEASLLKFAPYAHPELVNAMGGLELEARGWDPINKREIVSNVTDSSTPEEELLAPLGPDNPLPAGASTGRLTPVPFDNQAEVDAWARSHWYAARRIGNMAYAEIHGDPLVRAGNLVQIDVQNRQGLPHGTSGKYLVHAVRHMIKPGYFHTYMSLSRSGTQDGDENLTGIQRTSFVPDAREALDFIELPVISLPSLF